MEWRPRLYPVAQDGLWRHSVDLQGQVAVSSTTATIETGKQTDSGLFLNASSSNWIAVGET
jgi:hypothetical protein